MSSKQLFLKVLRISQESTWVEVLFNKAADPQNCNFIKKRLQRRYFPIKFAKFLRITFLCRTSPVAASDSFRFPACNIIKNEAPEKIKFL